MTKKFDLINVCRAIANLKDLAITSIATSFGFNQEFNKSGFE